jgi:hypothetical protein
LDSRPWRLFPRPVDSFLPVAAPLQPIAVRLERHWHVLLSVPDERQMPEPPELPGQLCLRSLMTERVGQPPFSLLLLCSPTWSVRLAPPFLPPREGEPGRMLSAHLHLGIQMVYS